MNEYKRRERRRKRRIQIAVRMAMTFLVAGLLLFTTVQIVQLIRGSGDSSVLARAGTSGKGAQMPTKTIENPPDYEVQLLTINEYSRPGLAIDQITGIVIHYTANPGTTAQQNRDYFEGLKDSHAASVSSHFVIGMAGELIQCIPCNEVAYASNDRNHDTISIECCIPDDTGEFTDATYDTLIQIVAWLVGRYELSTDAVIRHYDVTGKNCPKYYVEHEDAWFRLKSDVLQYIDKNGT